MDAINKIIDHWNLRSKLNLSVDPCIQNATWAPETANPRIACDCSDTVCHITHLLVTFLPSLLYIFLYFALKLRMVFKLSFNSGKYTL